MKNIKPLIYKKLVIFMICSAFILLFKITAFASADNSLSKLNIEGIELEPTFKYNRLNYNATVENDITDVKVNAVTSNRAAKILNISGNTNLKVGDNTINIIVQAKNGRKATYSILLTRKAGDNDNETDNDTESYTDTETKPEKKEKTSEKKLKDKLKKKNKKIKELKNTVAELTQKSQSVETKYSDILSENQKIYSQRIFMIILILILLFLLLISLFIGSIKKTTRRYLKREFQMDEKSLSAVQKEKKSHKRKKAGRQPIDDDSDYAVMTRVPKVNSGSDTLIANIENVIAKEIKSNSDYSENLQEIENRNQLSRNGTISSKTTDNKDKKTVPDLPDKKDKEDFSFDIIEI